MVNVKYQRLHLTSPTFAPLQHHTTRHYFSAPDSRTFLFSLSTAIMVSYKKITMHYLDEVYTTSINSAMAEGDEIYQALRDVFSSEIHESWHIVIQDMQHDNELVRLHYNTLKQGRDYLITISPERLQGAGTSSAATRKTAENIAVILDHWKLTEASLIFPPSIAPRVQNGHGNYPTASDPDTLPQDPYLWPTRLTSELRKLSVRSQNMHDTAMEFLLNAVLARHDREERAVKHATTGDIKIAIQNRIQQVADRAVAELPEEKAATETYAGGLGESLPDVTEEAVEEVGELATYELKTAFVDWESLKRDR